MKQDSEIKLLQKAVGILKNKRERLEAEALKLKSKQNELIQQSVDLTAQIKRIEATINTLDPSLQYNKVTQEPEGEPTPILEP